MINAYALVRLLHNAENSLFHVEHSLPPAPSNPFVSSEVETRRAASRLCSMRTDVGNTGWTRYGRARE